MRKRRLPLVVIFALIIVLIFNGVVLAGEAAHSTAETHAEVHHAPPVYYYVQWALLFLILVLGINYVLSLKVTGKRKVFVINAEKITSWIPPTLRPKHEGLAYILAGAVFTIFLIGYSSAVFEYHEPTWLIFVRFILYFLAGILMTCYGVLGRHDEHEAEEEHPSAHGH